MASPPVFGRKGSSCDAPPALARRCRRLALIDRRRAGRRHCGVRGGACRLPGHKVRRPGRFNHSGLGSYAGRRCPGDLPQGVRSIVPAPVLAQLRKNAVAVGSGTPSSARGCRIAEITGSNPLSSTRKSARAAVGPGHRQVDKNKTDRNDARGLTHLARTRLPWRRVRSRQRLSAPWARPCGRLRP
jgi:hypothetical protein